MRRKLRCGFNLSMCVILYKAIFRAFSLSIFLISSNSKIWLFFFLLIKNYTSFMVKHYIHTFTVNFTSYFSKNYHTSLTLRNGTSFDGSLKGFSRLFSFFLRKNFLEMLCKLVKKQELRLVQCSIK